jgi:hypothetical protein
MDGFSYAPILRPRIFEGAHEGHEGIRRVRSAHRSARSPDVEKFAQAAQTFNYSSTKDTKFPFLRPPPRVRGRKEVGVLTSCYDAQRAL